MRYDHFFGLPVRGTSATVDPGTNPHTWANRLLDFNFSVQADVYETLGPPTPVDADGDAIIAVQGQDGAGRSPLQLTAGLRALWETNITPTGRSGGRLDGTDDRYVLSTSVPAAEFQSFSMVCVCKPTTGVTSTIFSSATTTGACQIRINTLGIVQLLKNGLVNMGSSTAAVTFGSWNFIGVKYDGTTITFYVNANAPNTVASTQTFTSVTDGIFQSNTTELYTGDFGDLVAVSDLKTDAEFDSARIFEKGYWGTV